MQKPTQETSGASDRSPQHDFADEQERDDHDDGALRETLEKAASAYFSACRKLARAISHLKG